MPSGTLISVEEYLATSYRPDCDYVEGRIEERNLGEWDHSKLQAAITAYFFERRKSWNISVAGLHEFKGDILRTENPALEMPLAEVFA